MDAVSLKLARNYTNEKLNSLPSNRPTKTVSFDGGIYSVGNDVVNGQISDVVLKGNTWTNKAGVGDTSPQTIASLDSAKTYLLIKTDGGTVNVDGVDTAVPAKITGKTSTVLTWTSGKIALYELSTTEAALDAAALGQKYHYVNSTKSTNSVRVKSVGRNLCETANLDMSGAFDSFSEYVSVAIQKDRSFYVKADVSRHEDGTIQIYGYNSKKDQIWQSNFTTSKFTTPNNISWNVTDSAIITGSLKNEDTKYIRFRQRTKSTASYTINNIVIAYEDIPYEPYKESVAHINLPEPLRSLPNGTKDEISVSDGKLIKKIGSKVNVASGTVINYADMVTSGQFVAYYADGTQQVGLKGDTLTADAVTLTYQLATPIVTKLPAQAPLQVFENGTVYVEPIGDASESTLPSVEMTIPTGTSNKFGVASHDYDGDAADWTLTNSESKCFLLAVSSAGGAANIIAPDAPGVMYAVKNASGQTITVKTSGGTGVAITNGKKVLVIHDGTDYTALTAEL